MAAIVHVIVFSNFEGWSKKPGETVAWLDACWQAHPYIRWTHMYNPWHLLMKHLPEVKATEAVFTPYVRGAQDSGRAEVGLHIHLYYELARRAGVEPRRVPQGLQRDCSSPLPGDKDDQGYGILMTAYTPEERSTILDVSLGAFLCAELGRPKSFVAAYSATDPALQAMLASKGFIASFGAQSIPPVLYGTCWDRSIPWRGQITPLSIPYRVSRDTILPPPYEGVDSLDLVEVPLNMGTDQFEIYLDDKMVSRTEMFDRHYDWARDHESESAVAIGVHADLIADDDWGSGIVYGALDSFLNHVKARGAERGAEIRYSLVSEVANRFWGNRTVGSLAAE
jgi:hypothetical protein